MGEDPYKIGLLYGRTEHRDFGHCSFSVQPVKVLGGQMGDEQVRNFLSTEVDHRGFYLSDLRIHGTALLQHPQEGIVRWGVEYQGISGVNLEDGERMVRTLRRINRGLVKLTERLGHPLTFGQYVGHVAQVLRAESVIFREGENLGFHSDHDHHFVTVGEGVRMIDSLVQTWQHQTMSTKEAA